MVMVAVYLLDLDLDLDLVMMGAQVTNEEYVYPLLESYLLHCQKEKL